jgi:hypothetical protein
MFCCSTTSSVPGRAIRRSNSCGEALPAAQDCRKCSIASASVKSGACCASACGVSRLAPKASSQKTAVSRHFPEPHITKSTEQHPDLFPGGQSVGGCQKLRRFCPLCSSVSSVVDELWLAIRTLATAVPPSISLRAGFLARTRGAPRSNLKLSLKLGGSASV